MRKLLSFSRLGGALLGVTLVLSAQYQDQFKITWIEPNGGSILPELESYDSTDGTLGVLNASGPVDTDHNPFFTPLGTNGRACVSCHQPAYGMSVSAAGMLNRWNLSDGKDPVFAAFDGSNCPSLPQADKSSHSLLIDRGLFRIPLDWPPKNPDGSAKPVEFKIEVVRDPTSCNTSPVYGLNSAQPTISVYRRPREVANLKYVIAGAQAILAKSGELAAIDPQTGKPSSMNLMTDGREISLSSQAISAILGHEQATAPPSRETLDRIVKFESQVYAAQMAHIFGGPLVAPDGPQGLGVDALRDHPAGAASGALSGAGGAPVFGAFTPWKNGDYLHSSIARGAEIFMYRQFWIRDAAHFNDSGVGNPVKGTCASCHNAPMTGQGLAAGWMDVGTTNFPTWTESPEWAESSELPVFKITCSPKADPHPYLGRLIYTTDPGRALITGKCADVGAIVMQQLRGLAARAPYFANGSAKSLREVVDFYDRRFDIKLTDQEKEDLTNFLGVL